MRSFCEGETARAIDRYLGVKPRGSRKLSATKGQGGRIVTDEVDAVEVSLERQLAYARMAFDVLRAESPEHLGSRRALRLAVLQARIQRLELELIRQRERQSPAGGRADGARREG